MQIFKFSKDGAAGSAKDVAKLGGKGAHLAEMASLGLPVPPGFTIPTDQCVHYMQSTAKETVIDNMIPQVTLSLEWLQEQFGYMPLVSVRSGAPVSMPGMMDTVLNVGLTDKTLSWWADKLGDRAALDSYRRLIQMYGEVVDGIPAEYFDGAMVMVKMKYGVELDSELTVEALADLVDEYKDVYAGENIDGFPQSVRGQVRGAIEAVFKSWNNDRAKHYRKMHGISENMGTAVTVQAMVFGNLNDKSGSGVLFTRNPVDGGGALMGEFLPNAQGEDVVAGTRTPLSLQSMQDKWPSVYESLYNHALMLEGHYRDMQDIEFTIQDGELFILQTRTGKRTAKAAFQIAYDLWQEGEISFAECCKRLTPKQYLAAKRPVIDPTWKVQAIATGLGACNGVAIGKIVFSAEEAVNSKEPVILVTKETTPDDIAGMEAAAGILTQTGGSTSHAAVVARAMDKPCVTGCTVIRIQDDGILAFDEVHFEGGDWLTIDGETGNVFPGKAPIVDGANSECLQEIVRTIFEAKGLVERTPGLNGNKSYILAADWFGREAGNMEEFEKAYADIEEPEIYIDMTRPEKFVSVSDRQLFGIFGDSFEEKADKWQSAIYSWLVEKEFKGVSLLNCDNLMPSEIDAIKAKGYKIIKTATCLEDILSGDAVPGDEFIKKIVKNKKTWDQLWSTLKEKHGLNDIVVPIARTATEAVFEYLAA